MKTKPQKIDYTAGRTGLVVSINCAYPYLILIFLVSFDRKNCLLWNVVTKYFLESHSIGQGKFQRSLAYLRSLFSGVLVLLVCFSCVWLCVDSLFGFVLLCCIFACGGRGLRKDTLNFLLTLTLPKQACSMFKYFGQLKHVNSVYGNSERLPASVANRFFFFSYKIVLVADF